MKRQPRQYDDDDGRVICSMDVPGMRWHDKSVRRKERAERKTAHPDQMTRSEAMRYTWYSVLSGLLIVLVFSATWVLFILLCTRVWFR
jgi:hypothetical protein